MPRNTLSTIVVAAAVAFIACERGGAAAPAPVAAAAPAETPAKPAPSPPPAAPPAPSAAAPTEAPTVVAGRWLAALRARDAAAIGALTAVPFLTDGFDPETGPVRDKCKQAAEGGPKAKLLRLRADTTPALDDVFTCLFKDPMLTTSIPKYAPETWPAAPPPPGRGATGALKVVEPAQIAKRLARYKKDVKALAPGQTLVEASYTDNNGITVYALMPLKDGKVTGFLSDLKFEH
jgi:hypothetical protein